MSAQLYDWSEDTTKPINHLSQAQAKPVAQKSSTFKESPSRLHYQAIQTMWKIRLQMRRRTGTRTEVLSFGQPSRHTAEAGIHSTSVPGSGRNLSDRFSVTSRDNRGDLQYQFGVIASTRKLVRRYLAQGALIQCPTRRRESGRHIGRQHARIVAYKRAWRARFPGGER